MAEENLKPSKNQLAELIKDHLHAEDPECRWCFAIDQQRIKGEVIARHSFPDSMLLQLSCPRCEGEFTYYFSIWEGDYVLKLISKLHPELEDKLKYKLFRDMNTLIFPEYTAV